MTLPVLILSLGHILWIVAYVATIRMSLATKLVGIPIAAVLLNITWEGNILSGCGLLNQSFLPSGLAFQYCGAGLSLHMQILLGLTLVLDAVLLLQVVAYGWPRDANGAVREQLHWLSVVILGLCGAAALHVVIMLRSGDYYGILDAWLINLIMSVLFLDLLRQRRNGEGLSLVAAWAKLFGSALNAIFLLSIGNLRHPLELMLVLFVSVLIIDVAYAVWLTKLRRGLPSPQPAPNR